ncbi:MAG: cofactor assembly of complex C subunit B [Limnospira sp.]
MTFTVIPSTFFLTLLLGVGLFFFIRASVKDRTQQETLSAAEDADTLLEQIQHYFSSRAYRAIAIDPQDNAITYEGIVRPSWFLAIFLTLLTAVGALCLGLVLSMVVPAYGNWFLTLALLSPLAGWFYWRQARRPERVSLKLEAVIGSENQTQSIIRVTAHRDELITLKQTLGLKPSESA